MVHLPAGVLARIRPLQKPSEEEEDPEEEEDRSRRGRRRVFDSRRSRAVRTSPAPRRHRDARRLRRARRRVWTLLGQRRARHPPRRRVRLRRRVVCSSFVFFIFAFCSSREPTNGAMEASGSRLPWEPARAQLFVARQSHAVRRRAEEPARDALEGVAHDDVNVERDRARDENTPASRHAPATSRVAVRPGASGATA